MNRQELLDLLHQYTPWELLHMQNLDNLEYMDQINLSLKVPVTEAEKSFGLHLPHVPDASNNTFSEQLFFTHGSMQEIQIVQHDRYTPPVLHKHDFFELVYVYEGEFVHQISSRKLLMHTGDLCLIPPEVYHSLDVRNYSVILNILIPQNKFRDLILKEVRGHSLLSRLFAASGASPGYFLFHTCGETQIQQLILDMCLESLNQEPYYLHMIHANFLLLLGLLLRHFSASCEFPVSDDQKTSLNILILQDLDKNYASITLSELADKFHYSPQYISNRIKQITGMSFSDYLLQKRMQTASDMLINTNLKIMDISKAAGYQNPEHFIRTFRKYFGSSPGAYRDQHKILL